MVSSMQQWHIMVHLSMVTLNIKGLCLWFLEMCRLMVRMCKDVELIEVKCYVSIVERNAITSVSVPSCMATLMASSSIMVMCQKTEFG